MSTAPVTVTTDAKPFSLNEKRFYIPGTVLRSKCPECGEDCEQDLARHYLSYPHANEPITVTFYHEKDDDDHEWDVTVIVRVTVEAVSADPR